MSDQAPCFISPGIVVKPDCTQPEHTLPPCQPGVEYSHCSSCRDCSMLEKLNITYHPPEDRLLLRALSTDQGEYRIWMTRRFSGILLDVLSKLMNEAGGVLDIASSQETLDRLKAGAITETPLPFRESTKLPLGEGGILGFRIDYGRETSGTVNLQLLPEQGQGLKLSLDRSSLFMLYNMLEQGIINADWKLATSGNLRHPVH